MIIVGLSGGLANQMFQYAAGRRLAEHHNTELQLDGSLYFSKSRPKPDKEWPYALDCFEPTQVLLKESPLPQESSGVLGKLKSKLSGPKFNVLKEKHYHFNPEVLKAPDNTYLDGYWQSEKYFTDIADILRKEFVIKSKPDKKNTEVLAAIKAVNSVSLHVRRGDYVANASTNEFHGTSPLDYYRDAIADLTTKVKDPHFFVFSDDPEWCKENLKFDFPTTYVDHNSADKGYEDMRLMSNCQHHIVANSSFSWWGAWLDPNPDKLVYAPKNWFKDSSINTSDLVPATWKRL